MPAPPTKTSLSGTPTNAVFNAGIGAFWDYVTGLLGLSGDAVDARAALGAAKSGAITGSGLTMATARLLGRLTGGSGAIEELTGAQAQGALPLNQARVDVASSGTVNLTTGAANTDHVNITGTTTITGFTVTAGRLVFVRFAAALTLTNNANIVTQSGANISVQAGDTCMLRATAANVVEVLAFTSVSKIQLAAAQSATSGTVRDFTGLPSTVNRVTVMYDGLSTSGSSVVQVQLGTAGGVETSAYVCGTQNGNNAPGFYSSGFAIENGGGAAYARSGQLVLTKVAGNTWSCSGIAVAAGAQIFFTTGGKTLSNVLDRIRITTVNGTDTFDAGTVNIAYE